MLRFDKPDTMHTFRYEAMATDFSLSLGGVDSAYARQAAHEASLLLAELESKLSLYRETSDVTRINRCSSGQVVTVSEECMSCLREALDAGRLTGGRFNALLGREACRAKGFLPPFLDEPGRLASDGEALGPALAIDPDTRRVERLHEQGLLDLGGIGKGFALDRMLECLEDWEIPRVLLNSGGSTLLLKGAEGNAPWRGYLGERAIAPFHGGAIASSGLGFQERHIVAPDSGASVCFWTRSYARAATAALADALSTAAMLMDWPEIEALARVEPGLAFAVEKGDELRLSAGF